MIGLTESLHRTEASRAFSKLRPDLLHVANPGVREALRWRNETSTRRAPENLGSGRGPTTIKLAPRLVGTQPFVNYRRLLCSDVWSVPLMLVSRFPPLPPCRIVLFQKLSRPIA